VREGRLDQDFALRARDAQKQVNMRLLDEIDELFEWKVSFRDEAACPLNLAECV